MNPATIWAFLKNILPTKKIGAWIVGILAAIVALVMGVKNSELKDAFCASAPVELPKIEVQPAAPTPAPAAQPEAKK
jgi:hypothetical protein